MNTSIKNQITKNQSLTSLKLNNMKNQITNQIRKSRINITIILFAIISMFSVACTPHNVNPCNTTNTLFQQIYNNVVAIPGNSNLVTMDSDVHGYNFTVSTNKTICSIGYQSQPAVATQLYKIEIIDNTTSTTLYNFSTTFSSTTTSYVSVPNISVVPGHSYTIKRTLLNSLGNVTNTVGRLVTSSTYNLSFPYTVGDMSITGADFGTTSVSTTFGIPFIDIVFQ